MLVQGSEYKHSKFTPSQLRICTMVSIYSMLVAKDKKKPISNPFSLSICNNCYAFIQVCVTKRVPLFDCARPIEVSWV